MKWTFLIVVGLLLLVVMAAIPSWRRTVLEMLYRTLTLAVIVTVAACLVFHLCPELAPPSLADLLGQVLERVEDACPALRLTRLLDSPWLILAAIIVVAAIPGLARLRHASRPAANGPGAVPHPEGTVTPGTVRYEPDQTLGHFCLRDPYGILNPEEHTTLEKALGWRYRRLVDKKPLPDVLRLRLARRVVRFQLTMLPQPSPRCPTLILHRLPEEVQAPVQQRRAA